MQTPRARHPLLLRALSVLLGMGVATALVEAGGRVFLCTASSYHVVFLEPDRVVAWKQLPDRASVRAAGGRGAIARQQLCVTKSARGRPLAS
jgi:hypothetical protein